MNSVTIDGKRYVKATEIARELGYTADYVGQLCRKGKVDAQLVGRSWYVNEVSLKNHKKTRYKSNEKGTKHANTKRSSSTNSHIETEADDDTYSVPVSVKTHGARIGYGGSRRYVKKKQNVAQAYYEDDSELIPITRKHTHQSTNVAVHTNEDDNVQKLRIASVSKPYNFEKTPRPEIKFHGELSISEASDLEEDNKQESPEESSLPIENHKDTNNIRVDVQDDETSVSPKETKSSRLKVRHATPSKRKKQKRHFAIEHNAHGVIGMKSSRITERNPLGGTLKINATQHAVARNTRTQRYVLVASFLLSIVVSAALFALHSSVVVENGQMVTSYIFDPQVLIASVASVW